MQFFCVQTQAIQLTHRALQQLGERCQGSSNPSRALRVASLYGHLQWRAKGSGQVQFTVRELANAWHLQPRLLRHDLADLEALGWLQVRSGPWGTKAELNPPLPLNPSSGPVDEQAPDLLETFALTYNRHRPRTWPPYQPRGSGLLSRLKRAVRSAGSAEVFWSRTAQALAGMPAFWRDVYPKNRSGRECIAALLSADRAAAGLGPEFWHVFCWGSEGPETKGASADDELERARRLFLWDGHRWRGQGMEALKLSASEKLALTQLLEAHGDGPSGAAEGQLSAPAELY